MTNTRPEVPLRMKSFYVMRRANGDLFGLERDGQLIIPVWPSEEAAARNKARLPELRVFWPVRLERARMEKVSKGGSGTFFLISGDARVGDFDSGRVVAPEDIFPGGPGVLDEAV